MSKLICNSKAHFEVLANLMLSCRRPTSAFGIGNQGAIKLTAMLDDCREAQLARVAEGLFMRMLSVPVLQDAVARRAHLPSKHPAEDHSRGSCLVIVGPFPRVMLNGCRSQPYTVPYGL